MNCWIFLLLPLLCGATKHEAANLDPSALAAHFAGFHNNQPPPPPPPMSMPPPPPPPMPQPVVQPMMQPDSPPMEPFTPMPPPVTEPPPQSMPSFQPTPAPQLDGLAELLQTFTPMPQPAPSSQPSMLENPPFNPVLPTVFSPPAQSPSQLPANMISNSMGTKPASSGSYPNSGYPQPYNQPPVQYSKPPQPYYAPLPVQYTRPPAQYTRPPAQYTQPPAQYNQPPVPAYSPVPPRPGYTIEPYGEADPCATSLSEKSTVRSGSKLLFLSWDNRSTRPTSWNNAASECKKMCMNLLKVDGPKDFEFVSMFAPRRVDTIWISQSTLRSGSSWAVQGVDARPGVNNFGCFSLANERSSTIVNCESQIHFICEKNA